MKCYSLLYKQYTQPSSMVDWSLQKMTRMDKYTHQEHNLIAQAKWTSASKQSKKPNSWHCVTTPRINCVSSCANKPWKYTINFIKSDHLWKKSVQKPFHTISRRRPSTPHGSFMQENVPTILHKFLPWTIQLRGTTFNLPNGRPYNELKTTTTPSIKSKY